MRGEVMQADFDIHEAAEVRALLVSPTGIERVVPMTRNPALHGVYEAEIVADESGDYHVHLELDENGETLRGSEARFSVSADEFAVTGRHCRTERR